MIAEVPEALAPACDLFSASGYVQEAILTDYIWQGEEEEDDARGFVIPITVDDLAANGLLGEAPPSPSASARQVPPQVCWERSVETLTAMKDDIAGLAVASDERIEAYLLHLKSGEIVSLRTFIEDGGARLKQLLSRLLAGGMRTFRLPKVHPAEVSEEVLKRLGFRPASRHRLYVAKAQSAQPLRGGGRAAV